MRTIFAKIIDNIALLFSIFLLVFAWVRFYTRDTTSSLICGIVASVAVCFVVNILLNKKEKRVIRSSKERKSAETLALNLLGATNDEILAYFEGNLRKTATSIKRGTNYLILGHNSAQNEMHSTVHSTLHSTTSATPAPINDTIVFPCFFTTTLSLNDAIGILKIARLNKVTDIKIYAVDFSPEAKAFLTKAAHITCKFYNQYEMFADLEGATFPDTIFAPQKNYCAKEILSLAFDRKRAKNYLLFGLIIIISSFLVPYKIYYLVLGSALCLVALIVRILPLIKKDAPH